MADVAGPPPEDVFHDHIEDQPCKDEPLEESDDQVADLIGLERPAREAGDEERGAGGERSEEGEERRPSPPPRRVGCCDAPLRPHGYHLASSRGIGRSTSARTLRISRTMRRESRSASSRRRARCPSVRRRGRLGSRATGSSSPPSNHSAIAESSPSSHRRSARSARVPSEHPPWSSITVTGPPPRSRAVPSLPGIRGSSRHPPPPRSPPDGTRRRRVAPRPSRRAHATGSRPPSPSVQEPSPPPA